jgi:hypothetical protein
MKKNQNTINVNRRPEPSVIHLGFGIFAHIERLKPRFEDDPAPDDLRLYVQKPEGDFEVLLDRATFKRLKQFARKYWKRK